MSIFSVVHSCMKCKGPTTVIEVAAILVYPFQRRIAEGSLLFELTNQSDGSGVWLCRLQAVNRLPSRFVTSLVVPLRPNQRQVDSCLAAFTLSEWVQFVLCAGINGTRKPQPKPACQDI